MEPISLYRGLYDEVPVDPYTIPFGRAAVRREGGDVTVVSWGPPVHSALEAAETLASEGVSAEVIDLRTLYPWDRDTVLAGVEKTGRLGPAPTATAEPAPAPAAAPERTPGGTEAIRAMPKVRKLAAERSIDLATVTGTGPGGSMTVADLDASAPPAGGRRERLSAPDDERRLRQRNGAEGRSREPAVP